MFTEQKGKTVTPAGNSNISTAQFKFGGASGYFDGTGDYIVLADSADWQFGTGDFTIEGWFYCTGTISTNQYLLRYGKDTYSALTDLGFRIMIVGSKIYGSILNGTTDYGIQGTTTLSANTLYYYKFYRVSGTLYLNLNGTQEATGAANVSVNAPGTGWDLRFGQGGTGNLVNYTGYLDDHRITKGVGRSGTTVPTDAFPNQ